LILLEEEEEPSIHQTSFITGTDGKVKIKRLAWNDSMRVAQARFLDSFARSAAVFPLCDRQDQVVRSGERASTIPHIGLEREVSSAGEESRDDRSVASVTCKVKRSPAILPYE
jgi:hypothetical protein